MYLFVAILENGRHLGFSIDQSEGMDLITIEMSHANFGACIIICTIHPNNANYLLHSKSVTTCPKATVTTCPNVISLTKFAILENKVYLTSSDLFFFYIQGSVYSLNHEHVYIHNILLNYMFKKAYLACIQKISKTPFFFHMAYFCRARDYSHEITRGMLKCNTKHTTIVWTHLY